MFDDNQVYEEKSKSNALREELDELNEENLIDGLAQFKSTTDLRKPRTKPDRQRRKKTAHKKSHTDAMVLPSFENEETTNVSPLREQHPTAAFDTLIGSVWSSPKTQLEDLQRMNHNRCRLPCKPNSTIGRAFWGP